MSPGTASARPPAEVMDLATVLALSEERRKDCQKLCAQ